MSSIPQKTFARGNVMGSYAHIKNCTSRAVLPVLLIFSFIFHVGKLSFHAQKKYFTFRAGILSSGNHFSFCMETFTVSWAVTPRS